MILTLSLIFIFTALFCIGLERWAPAWGLLDEPGQRKMQIKPIPRAGGLAIFVTYFLTQVILGQFTFSWVWLGALVVYLGGLYDDSRPNNSVKMKLAFQITAALCAAVQAPNLFVAAFIFVFVMGMINSFNLMDNMNGLTAGMSVVLLIAFTALTTDHAFIYLPLAAALLGFLVRNYPFGKIFLGDQGSQFLGYWLSVSAIQVVQHNSPGNGIYFLMPACVFLAILFMPFIIDTLTVIIIRFKQHTPIYKGDQNHLSHQLYRMGLRPAFVTMIFIFFQILCSVLGVWFARHWQNLV